MEAARHPSRGAQAAMEAARHPSRGMQMAMAATKQDMAASQILIAMGIRERAAAMDSSLSNPIRPISIMPHGSSRRPIPGSRGRNGKKRKSSIL